MSWVEVDGAGWSWVEVDGAGWSWVHGLVIPIGKQSYGIRLRIFAIFTGKHLYWSLFKKYEIKNIFIKKRFHHR